MNNLESIIKNVVALLIGLFVWRKYRNVPNQDLASWVSPILIGATTLFTLWFGIKTYDDSEEPVNLSTDIPIATVDSLSSDTIPADTANLMNKDQTEDNTEIQSTEDGNTVVVSDPASDEIKDANDPNVNNDNSDEVSVMEVTPNQHTINLINKHNKFSDGSKINFESGTSLICLFSMTCSHCQEVYKEMCQLNDQMPKTYLINFGAEFEQNYFFKQAGGCKLPHNRIEDFTQFKRLLEGKSYPRILVVKNGNIVRDWDVDSYSRAKLMKYFGMKEPTKKDDDGGLNLETGGSPW